MAEKKGQNFLHGAAIYTVGIILVKVLGAVYKIPLGNILDDEGFAFFDITYKIYNFFLTVATAGLPVAMSRLISEADSLDRDNQVYRIFKVSTVTFLALGAVGTALMMLFPAEIAAYMHKVQTARSIFIMAPSVVLVCVTAAYRGYAQGHGDMIPTTVSQVIETAVKVVVGLGAAGYLYKAGYSMEICVAGAILGTTVSSVAAMLYMVVKVHRKYKVRPGPEAKDKAPSNGWVLSNLLRIGIPITISTSIMSIIQVMDAQITMARLQGAAGYSDTAAGVLYGVYGKAMTVYNVPSAFVVPFLSSIVPAVAAARMKQGNEAATDLSESALRMSTLLCLPMAVGMAVLAEPCMRVLYPQSAGQGALLLFELGITCYFMTMSLMTNSILPAYGNERLPLVSILLGGAAKVLVTYTLVGNPNINVYGAPLGTLSCYLVMLGTNLFFMARHMSRPMNIGKILGRSGLSAIVMGIGAWAVWSLLHGLMGGVTASVAGRELNILLPFAAAVCAGVVIYFVLVIALRAITLEDMKLFPKGEKLAAKLHIR